VKLAELVAWLDTYLRVADTPDDRHAFNGLQVDGPPEVSRIAVAVDACQVVIDAAVAAGAQLLVVHHGLFWDGLGPVTGRRHKRLATLLRHDLALYSAHIPLDVHPDVGNNVLLARRLGIPVEGWWGSYEGRDIGVSGSLEIERDALGRRLADLTGAPVKVLPGGPARCHRIGVVSGAAGSMIADAQAAGIDTFITGEVKHHNYFDAEELGLNVILGGHYATETFGVKALAEQVAERYRLPWTFIDHPTGL
jgi:dinuclear metal center YbgI/SA1388 family protein